MRAARPSGPGAPARGTTGVTSGAPSGSAETRPGDAGRGTRPVSPSAVRDGPSSRSTRCRCPPVTSQVSPPGTASSTPPPSSSRHPIGEHGRADQRSRGRDLVAHRPVGRGPRSRIHADGTRDGGGRGPRRAGEHPVVDEHRLREHRSGPQGGEHEPSGHGVRHGHQPVRVVGDDVERTRRPGDQQVLALPRGARHGDRHHQRHDQAEHAQHDPGRDRPALRADLLVHRHRVAAHEGGLQPAQAEPVRVDLVTGRRAGRRHPRAR